MISRAYHDSLFISRIAPVAMLFIPVVTESAIGQMSMHPSKISRGARLCWRKRWPASPPDNESRSGCSMDDLVNHRFRRGRRVRDLIAVFEDQFCLIGADLCVVP